MMDFEQNKDVFGPVPVQGSAGSQRQGVGAISDVVGHETTARTSNRGTGWKIFCGVTLAISILANMGLLLMLIVLIAIFGARGDRLYSEALIQDGPRSSKIVVVSIEGVIQAEQAENVYKQIREARSDRSVKGLILRINSPGGTISGSDGIYNEVCKYRKDTGKPVVAFMQGVAASGGYYASVACDKIVAEPTALTGSIGVMMGHFVLEELLEKKLGIRPVILTEGRKKDWPSSFRAPSDEELQYLREKVLSPAYERFVDVIAEGRSGLLTLEEVRQLADGGIVGAQEAMDKKLIDKIGYLDEAVEMSKSLAGIEEARVVEYHRVFSLSSILSSKSADLLRLDRSRLYELGTPQILYLWGAYW